LFVEALGVLVKAVRMAARVLLEAVGVILRP
jgi:hypothetical protein